MHVASILKANLELKCVNLNYGTLILYIPPRILVHLITKIKQTQALIKEYYPQSIMIYISINHNIHAYHYQTYFMDLSTKINNFDHSYMDLNHISPS